MVEAQGVRLTQHQRRWLERIRAWEASGMTISAYAAEHGWDVRAMYGARKVLKRKGVLGGGAHPVRFQRARIVASDGVNGGEMSWRIALPNGVAVSFSGPVDAGSLSAVVRLG